MVIYLSHINTYMVYKNYGIRKLQKHVINLNLYQFKINFIRQQSISLTLLSNSYPMILKFQYIRYHTKVFKSYKIKCLCRSSFYISVAFVVFLCFLFVFFWVFFGVYTCIGLFFLFIIISSLVTP
jgi:hypothetical protein